MQGYITTMSTKQLYSCKFIVRLPWLWLLSNSLPLATAFQFPLADNNSYIYFVLKPNVSLNKLKLSTTSSEENKLIIPLNTNLHSLISTTTIHFLIITVVSSGLVHGLIWTASICLIFCPSPPQSMHPRTMTALYEIPIRSLWTRLHFPWRNCYSASYDWIYCPIRASMTLNTVLHN